MVRLAIYVNDTLVRELAKESMERGELLRVLMECRQLHPGQRVTWVSRTGSVEEALGWDARTVWWLPRSS